MTTFQRLPRTVVPVNYIIQLKPNLETLIFEGKQEVAVKVKDAVDKVILNSADLEIKTVNYVATDGTVLKPSAVDLCADAETLTVSFSQPLAVGDGTFSFEFLGKLNDNMQGLYRSKYTSPNGDVRNAAATQFESSDARRCFPCWDEPDIKATFDITLVIPENRVGLSNMPVISDSAAGEGLRILKFKRTPIMSTYLVAVIVGEFDYIEGKSDDGVEIKVYTPVGHKAQGLFALEVAIKALPYFKNYFGVAYPLPKLDLIALADFSGGAMENWGLLTFREVLLLVDPQNSSMLTRQRVALTVSHEIAHMWFGNLVTPEWWTDLWLKEGYASFMENVCVANQFEEYDIWTQFIINHHSCARQLDALKSTHPIEIPVSSPSEISEIFDTISYNKGASVIRMLHQYIGDNDFRKGMELYLKRHAYDNAQTKDLWAALAETSSKPVSSVMSTWTSQPGFPVIKVQSEQIGKNRKLSLTQSRFFANSNEEVDNLLWKVPVQISTSADPSKVELTYLLENKTGEVVLENVDPDAWINLNPGVFGFYRINYPSEMLTPFIPAIKNKSLPPLDRLGLLDDLAELVRAGQASSVEVLRLAEAYINEDNYSVWRAVDSCLHDISVLLDGTELKPQFNKFVCRLLRPAAQRIGWQTKPDESHLTTLLRALLVSRLARCGDEDTLKEAKRRFELHAASKDILPADLRGPVYSASVLTGDQECFGKLLQMYREAEMQEEKARLACSAATVNCDELRAKVYQFALSDEVRKQDSVYVIIQAAKSKAGRDMTWAFIKENWKDICVRYPDPHMKSNLIKYVAENFTSLEEADDVKKFFEEHPSEGTKRSIDQTVENIRVNAVWLARDKKSIAEFLSQITV